MKIQKHVDLSKYTTFKMGGIAKNLYAPESTEELLNIMKSLPAPHYYIGGGSNLLINDEREFDNVISLREFDRIICNNGDGHFIVGASVRLKNLIKNINDAGFGGIEYLFSVPGLMGGAIIMNAGRGKRHNQTLSDYLVDVTVLHNGTVVTYKKVECGFAHRSSNFKGTEDIILSAHFCFDKGSPEQFEKKRKDRVEFCEKSQDMQAPNFGTVFCEADGRIMRLICKLPGNKGRVHYSKRTANWMLNEGGTFQEALKAIDRVKKLHCLLRKNCAEEVIIWK